MDKDMVMAGPSLDNLQMAWLQEIGLDRHMLARWAAPVAVPLASPKSDVGAVLLQPGKTPDTSLHARLSLANTSAAISGLQRAAPKVSAVPPLEVAAAAVELPLDWAALEAHALACQACDLHMGRSAVVFGAGVLSTPEWMIIGEAPGSSDDRRGLPFQGKPGQLLQSMLASIGLGLPAVLLSPGTDGAQQADDPKTSIFCTNVIQCRPLGNRTPTPEEIAACMPYLQRQIELLQPKRILALGHLAAQALLAVDAPLDELRGKVHQFRSVSGRMIPLVATWHPATLLLRPQHKAEVWNDLNLARAVVLD